MRWCVLVLAVACGSAPRRAPGPAAVPVPPAVAATAPTAPAELAYLDTTLSTLAVHYIDPARFDPRVMLAGALAGLQRDVAEVIAAVDHDRVTLRVNDRTTTIAGDVDSLAELGLRLSEIIHFVQANANPNADRDNLELVAVNGMLSTLDPHTTLLSAAELREFETGIAGKFAGLGIVIGLSPDPNGIPSIAVTQVHPGTPAERGGLHAGDLLRSINAQATAGFTLDEAVTRLRGEAGSSVKLGIERAGAALALAFTRAEITIPAVTARRLARDVGYLRLEQFSEDAGAELAVAMTGLRTGGARAWVLDLRGNPGGLLRQAVLAADLFVARGTIVATVAGGKQQGVKRATPGGIDTVSPVVVMIDSDTASSAEILAGALKQLDRAVLVGRTSFGKGSVQVLKDAAHGGKLKVTTAEYVAANDISIQTVGIAPDIELQPVVVPAAITDATTTVRLVPGKPFHESDLGSHLITRQVVDHDRPVAVIRYLEEPVASSAPEADFEVRVARDLAAGLRARPRHDQLRELPALVVGPRRAADRRVAAALARLGVTWTPRPGAPVPKLSARIGTATPRIAADALVAITGEVTNDGATPASRVHARATSDDRFLDGVELVFGEIPAHTTKRAIAYVRAPKAGAPRAMTARWEITHDDGRAVLEVDSGVLALAGAPRPDFAYTVTLADDNDGIVERAERIRVRVRVTNRGPVRAGGVVGTLKSLVGEDVLVDRGRVELGALEPNRSRDIELVFATAAQVDRAGIELELEVRDAELGAAATQRLPIRFGARVATTRWELTPPHITLEPTPLETTADHLRIAGRAEDGQHVDDLYVTLTNHLAEEPRKVLYASGRGATSRRRLAFSTDVPLAIGANRIVVVAREHPGSEAVETIWVYRHGP